MERRSGSTRLVVKDHKIVRQGVTGSHLRIRKLSDTSTVFGLELEGNRSKPEPETFRVKFPGGDVDITRTTDNQYWVHVRVNHEGHGGFVPGEDMPARIVDARLDSINKATHEMNVGDFRDDGLYHLAVRIARKAVAS